MSAAAGADAAAVWGDRAHATDGAFCVNHAGVIITLWNAADGDVTSGVHFEVVVLDTILNYGQGFITLLLFGLSGELVCACMCVCLFVCCHCV